MKKRPTTFFCRRNVIKIAVCGIVAQRASHAMAATISSGLDVMNTPAIAVRSPALVSLQAINRVGKRLVAVGEHGVIIYSDDDAQSWSQARVPVDVTLTCVAFAAPMIGWAAGHFGVILNTVDGGETWKLQLNGLQANDLTMQAAQAAASDNDKSPGAPFALRRANAFQASGAGRPFFSLLAMSTTEVIVFGAYRMTMRTTDGGKTWADWSLHIEERLSNNLYDAEMAGPDIYVVGEEGLVFCSTDGGNSFQQVAAPSPTSLLGVIVARDNSILVFGVAGNAFRSTDAGKNWTAVNFDTQDNLVCGKVLDSGKILVANEANVFYVSLDNGASFKVAPPPPLGAIFDFVETPDHELVIAGPAGIEHLPAAYLNS